MLIYHKPHKSGLSSAEKSEVLDLLPNDVLKELSLRGIQRSDESLRRARVAGIIPQPTEINKGRGTGKVLDYPKETVDQFFAAIMLKQEQKISISKLKAIRSCVLSIIGMIKSEKTTPDDLNKACDQVSFYEEALVLIETMLKHSETEKYKPYASPIVRDDETGEHVKVAHMAEYIRMLYFSAFYYKQQAQEPKPAEVRSLSDLFDYAIEKGGGH